MSNTEKHQHKDMHGALFVNTKKTKPEHPDRTGAGTINGVPFRISGWIKQSKAGDAYLSLSFTFPQKGEDL